jgi:hypothetical protein
MAPAIGLLITGILGILFTLISIVMAFGPPPQVDPNASACRNSSRGEWSGRGCRPSLFVFVNIFIIFGDPASPKMRGVGITASVVAMLNVGTALRWGHRSIAWSS